MDRQQRGDARQARCECTLLTHRRVTAQLDADNAPLAMTNGELHILSCLRAAQVQKRVRCMSRIACALLLSHRRNMDLPRSTLTSKRTTMSRSTHASAMPAKTLSK